MVSNKINDYIQVTRIYGEYPIIITFHILIRCHNTFWIRGCITLEVENKSHQDFLSTHQAILCHAPHSLKEDLHSSYHILLGQSSSSLQSILFARAAQAQG